MSLRKIAKELGGSHTLLVLWRQGKRQLAPELEARYHQPVTSGYREQAQDLRFVPVAIGDPPRTRTENLLIKSQLLCQIELAGRPECSIIWM